MDVNGFLFFFLCILEVFLIRLTNPEQAPNTYALKNGVANISFEIDTKAKNYYVDVLNPKKKRIVQCLGSIPQDVPEEFKRKIKIFGNNKTGTISFSVLNVTEEDAGIYTSVIDITTEEVGRQLLVVFAQFQMPTISITKMAKNQRESGQKLTCHVETNGTPSGHNIPVNYEWKRNGYPVEHSDRYEFQKSALIIQSMLCSDLTGYFTCLAENEYGAKSPESIRLDISQHSMRYEEICEISCIHGTYSDVRGELKCNCKPGWTGNNCSTAIDACSTRPCLNGRCEMKLNTSVDYDCVCNEGWSGTNCNIHGSWIETSSYIPGVLGTGCAIIAVILVIFIIWYRTHKTSMDANMNSENDYHDVKRIQSGIYCTIDDEQIYDIRRRTKSEVLVVTNNTNPADDYPYLLQSDKCTETLKDGIQTAADGFLNPVYSKQRTALLKTTNAPSKSPNSSVVENTKQDDNCNQNKEPSTVKE